MEYSPVRDGRPGISTTSRPTATTVADPAAATVAVQMSNNNNTQRMKMLEEFLTNFPVDEPKQPALSHAETDDLGRPSNNPGRLSAQPNATVGASSSSPLAQGSGLTALNATVTSTSAAAATANAAQVRRQKMESLASIADRSNEALRKENELLERLAYLLQENCIDNDAKYEEALHVLKSQLQFAEVFRQDSTPMLQNIVEGVDSIQQLVRDLVSQAEKSNEEEHNTMQKAFAQQLEEHKAELDRVRESGKNTTHEWRTKNLVLQTALEELLEKTLTKYDELEELKRQSQKLRVSYSAQVDDNELLEQEYRKLYVTHVRLKERLTTLEAQVAQGPGGNTTRTERSLSGLGGDVASMEDLQLGLSPQQTEGAGSRGAVSPAFTSTSTPHDEQPNHNDEGQQYHAALKKTHALFEAEAANLQSVRDAHFAALRQRTELELYLRQAIVHHKMSRLTMPDAHPISTIADVQTAVGQAAKDRMLKASKNLDSRTVSTLEGPPVQFDVEDRKTIIDRLLSKHRVLELLYDEELSGDQRRHSSAPAARASSGQLRKASVHVDRRASTPGGRIAPPQHSADRVVHPVKEQSAGLADLLNRWQKWAGRANSELSNSSSM